MSTIYNNPIDLMGGFKRLESRPIDSDTVVSSTADLSTLTTAYAGMVCYVLLVESFYYYNGTSWLLWDFGGGDPAGIAGSIQIKGASGEHDGYSDFLWSDSNKKMQLGLSGLASVDEKIELYDDTNSHYMDLVGSYKKGIDPIDPERFDIAVKSTVPNNKSTFTLQDQYSNALMFIAANKKYQQFDTLNDYIEFYQSLKLKGTTIEGDNTMQSLVLDPVSYEVKKYTIAGGSMSDWELRTDNIFRKDVIDGGIVDFVAGTNMSVVYSGDGIITLNATAGGGGQVNTVVGGTDITVDATDPVNPIVNFSGTYDNYTSWNLKTEGIQRTTVVSGGDLDLVSGTGISTAYGAGGVVTITNTLPDQTVALTQGGTTVITGTYPNFTITSNDQYTGTITSISAGDGMDFTTITTSGTITMGTPSTLTAATTNTLTATSHTHEITGFSETGHTHLLATGATDVTATATELNLLDLSGLITGDVLSADGPTTASWKANVDNYVNGYAWFPLTETLRLLRSGGLSSIDMTLTGVTIPTGGTTGQHLTKVDNTDYNTEWTTPNAGTVVSVTAGDGMINSGTASDPILDIVATDGIVANGGDIAVEYTGTSNVVWSALLLESPATADSILYHDVTDGNVKKSTIDGLPFIQSITGLAGIVIGGTAIDITIKGEGLEYVTESTKTGRRLIDADPANYGNIGEEAVDFCFSETASSVIGATAIYSFATGYQTIASGLASFAGGNATEASGGSSFTHGSGTTADAANTFAMGSSTLAHGVGSFAFNDLTTANGANSGAIGVNTTATGTGSFAAGRESESIGNYSMALGRGAEAPNEGGAALGKFNIGTESTVIFEVGMGTIDTNRLNAFEVHNSGTYLGAVVAPEMTNTVIDDFVSTTHGNDLRILTTVDWVQTEIKKIQFTETSVIPNPTATTDTTMFFTDVAITIVQINHVLQGSTSIDWNLKHATTRDNGTPNDVLLADVTTSSTSGSEITAFNDETIPAGSWVWVGASAASGTPKELAITILYTID